MTDDTPDPVLEALSALREAGIAIEPVGEEFEMLAHRCATSPLSRQDLRPVEVFIEPRQHLSTLGALIMEH